MKRSFRRRPLLVFSGERCVSFFAMKVRTGASIGSSETYSIVPVPLKKKPTISSPALT